MTIKRGGRIFLEVLAGFAAVLVIALLVVFWRLTAGPVPVHFLIPYLERAFSAEGIRTDVGGTQLIWDGASREVQLEARSWRVWDAEGRRLAYLPRVELSLSLEALLRGTLAATRVELDRARLRVLRDESGRFAFAERPGDAEDVPDLSALANEVLTELMQPRDPQKAISYLQQIDIHDARLLLDDRRVDRRVEVRDASLQLWREVGGLGGHLEGQAALGEAQASVTSSLWYRNDQQVLQADTQFAGLRVPEFAPWAGLSELDGIDLTFDGKINAVVPVDGRLPSGSFMAAGQNGSVNLPHVFSLPFEVASLELEGEFDGPAQSLKVEKLQVQLGEQQQDGPVLSAAADIERLEAATHLSVEARAGGLSAQDLHDYWPTILRDGGRPWVVVNIQDGWADDGHVRASVTVPDDPTAEPEVHEVAGGFSFRDVEVHYLRPLPPATGVSGQASFDADAFEFNVEAGRVQDLTVPGGKVIISGLQEPEQFLEIDFDAQGPLPTVLRLLENPRLDLLEELGFSSEGSEGAAQAKVHFALPLEKEVTFDDVQVGVEGRLESVLLRRAVLEQDLSGGPLSLTLDQEGMRVTGDLALGGVPAEEVTWTEEFLEGGQTRVEAFVPQLDDASRARFGFDTGPELTGPLSTRISLVSGRQADTRIDLDVDLLLAELQLENLDWSKPAGTPGDLSARLYLRNDRPRRVENLQLVAGTMALLDGSVDFNEEGDPQAFHFPQASLGGSELQQLSVRPLPDGGTEIEVGAGRLDVEPFLSKDEEDADAQAEPEASPSTLRIVAPTLAELRFGENRYLQAVELRLHRDAAGWQDVVIRGEVPRHLWRYRDGTSEEDEQTLRKEVSLLYGRAAEGEGYALRLEADDLGASLRAVDLFDTLEGGELSIVGSSDGPLPASPMELELWAGDYTLVEAPAMARLLTIASLSGLGNLLAGEGIAFQRLTGQLLLEDGRLSSDLVRAYGPSLGITARGHLDLEGEETLVRGTLVPAYSINQVLGAIPLLGRILTGREGEGVLGVTYRLTGPIDEPRFAVNPLSVLAPGFLRGLFDLPAGDEGTSPPNAFPEGYDDTTIGN